LLWVAPLACRIANQPFGLSHWGMSFPLAALAALTLRLAPSVPLSLVGIALLAMTSLLVAAFLLATARGLRNGSLPAPEPVAATIAVSVP
jgi:tellurite resistance protein